MDMHAPRQFLRCLSLGSVDGISSPCSSAASEGSVPPTPVESPLRLDCVGAVRKTLAGLRSYLPADIPAPALCGALALAVRKEHGWVARWADGMRTGGRKGPWSSPLSHEALATPPAWSDCVLAVSPSGGAVACVVDTGFRAKFDIGAEGPIYEHALGRVPAAFVGTPTELLNKVDELSNGITSCFQYSGRELPPWRTRDSLRRLYKACLENDGSRREVTLLAPLEAALRSADRAADGFTVAEVEGLRAYLRAVGVAERDAPRWDPFDGESAGEEAGDEAPEGAKAAAAADRDGGLASNLTLLLEGLRQREEREAAPEAPELPLAAWCTLVPGARGSSMRRVKRLDDLSAHYHTAAL